MSHNHNLTTKPAQPHRLTLIQPQLSQPIDNLSVKTGQVLLENGGFVS